MWTTQTSPRDNWERLVAAVIKREQIWQLCHQDSITTVDSDFSQRDLSVRSVSFPPSPQLLPARNSEIKGYLKLSITRKLLSALLWRKKRKDIFEDHFGLKRFSLRELRVATDYFNNGNVLERGFPVVYKGRLADGSLVSVYRFRSSESEVMMRNCLEISSMVEHGNVIGLLGYCITEKERLLVHPYMANGSVAACLREGVESQAPLKWESRQRIALGVARGVAYLHEGCMRAIIHRDIKAGNILLDKDFEPVVADFTLSKFVDDDDYGIQGTILYIAPEYYMTGKSSLKTDVYGYGVFLLELITGQLAYDLARLPNDDLFFIDRVLKLYKESKFEVLVDENIKTNYVEEEMKKLTQIALMCTQTNPDERPTMSEIVQILEDVDDLTETCSNLHSRIESIVNYYTTESTMNFHSRIESIVNYYITESTMNYTTEQWRSQKKILEEAENNFTFIINRI